MSGRGCTILPIAAPPMKWPDVQLAEVFRIDRSSLWGIMGLWQPSLTRA